MIRITIFLEYYIDGKCRNNFFLKARSVNEVQYKKKEKLVRIWITVIRHGCLGH